MLTGEINHLALHFSRAGWQARLDFEDEVEEASQAELLLRMRQLHQQLGRALATRRRGVLLRSGLQVTGQGGCMCLGVCCMHHLDHILQPCT